MAAPKSVQLPTLKKKTALDQDIAAFLLDRRAQGFSPKTIAFYRSELGLFAAWVKARGILETTAISPNDLRAYLLSVAERRKPAAAHCSYRAVKTFFRWIEAEFAPENWTNPIARVKPPKLPSEPLEPVNLEHVKAMLQTCNRKTFADLRDKAMLLCLLDTGLRAAEFIALDTANVNLDTGAVVVKHGKGGKFRYAFIGHKAARALMEYLRRRGDAPGPLWVTTEGRRLTYWGLRQILRRRAEKAGVPAPTAHQFRRAFALMTLRAGVDVITLQRMMGHASPDVLTRYLRQTEADLAEAHRRAAPVDKYL